MGLDMYLTAERYLGRWDYLKETDRSAEYEQATATLEAAGLLELQTEDAGVTIRATAIYWRKANQIHNWFVQNVQGGIDNCESYHVSREQLTELAALCRDVLDHCKLVDGTVHNGTQWKAGVMTENYEDGKVIDEPEYAAEKLPVASGFFFGSTGYNEWYCRDLERTASEIDRVLTVELGEDVFVDFSYRSSW
jgi:hypothetical protein